MPRLTDLLACLSNMYDRIHHHYLELVDALVQDNSVAVSVVPHIAVVLLMFDYGSISAVYHSQFLPSKPFFIMHQLRNLWSLH